VTGHVPGRSPVPVRRPVPVVTVTAASSLGGLVERVARLLADADVRAQASADDGSGYALDQLRLEDLASRIGVTSDPEARAALDRRRDLEATALAHLYPS